MRLHTNRPHAWTATAMWNTEGLMQIQVRDISTKIAWARQTHLCIHIGTIHVNLAALRVHDRADLSNRLLKDSVRGGIGHHEGGQVFAMLGRLRLQVCQIHIALVITLNDHHLHPWKPYPGLTALDASPQLPTGYAGCLLLAAVPWAWFAVMDRRLDDWLARTRAVG